MTEIVDPLFAPVMQALLTCLTQELAHTAKGVPAHMRLTPGDLVVAALTDTVDECCEGIGSVRLVRYFPTDAFPAEAQRPASEGGPVSWAAELELQVVRCGAQPGPNMTPADADLVADAVAATEDQAAMRRAVCCLGESGAAGVLDYVYGAGEATSADGGCIGGTLMATFQVECAEC